MYLEGDLFCNNLIDFLELKDFIYLATTKSWLLLLTAPRCQEPQTDSAVSMCSSDNEGEKEEKEKDKKKRRGKKMIDKSLKERRSSKTLTEQDIKHIERHLSMKRTIRKKIMRDLQSTFVLGPTDYILPLPCHKDDVDKLGYSSESNILDMLRDSQDSGHDSPHR